LYIHNETLFVIEIADLSLDFDQNKKLPYYGKWQIPEAWLFDLNRRRIERHTDPNLEGYTRIEAVQGHGSLDSTTVPGLTVSVKATMG
jgi:Uma2 family endonuclease